MFPSIAPKIRLLTTRAFPAESSRFAICALEPLKDLVPAVQTASRNDPWCALESLRPSNVLRPLDGPRNRSGLYQELFKVQNR